MENHQSNTGGLGQHILPRLPFQSSGDSAPRTQHGQLPIRPLPFTPLERRIHRVQHSRGRKKKTSGPQADKNRITKNKGPSGIDERQRSEYDLLHLKFVPIAQKPDPDNARIPQGLQAVKAWFAEAANATRSLASQLKRGSLPALPQSLGRRDTPGSIPLISSYANEPLPDPVAYAWKWTPTDPRERSSDQYNIHQTITEICREHASDINGQTNDNDLGIPRADQKVPSSTTERSNKHANMAGIYASTDPFGNYVVPPPITYQPQYPPQSRPDSQPQSSALKKGETIRVTIGEVHGGQTMSQDIGKRNSIDKHDLSILGLDSLDLGEHRFPKEHLGFDINNNLYQKSPRWEPKSDLQPKITLQGGEVFDPNKYARAINTGVREFLLKDRVSANCRPDVDLKSLTPQQQFHRREILTRAWQLYCARELRARGNRGYYCIDRRNVLSLRNDETHLIEAAIVAKWEEAPSVPGGWAFVGADQLVLPNFEPIDMLGIFEAQLAQFNGDIEDMLIIRGQVPTPPASSPGPLIDPKQEQLGVSNKVKRAHDTPKAKPKRRQPKDESDDEYVP